MRAVLALAALAACGYPEPAQVFRDSGAGADSSHDGAKIDAMIDAMGPSAVSDAVWISNYGQEDSSNSTIMKISKSTNSVAQTVQIGSTPIYVGVDLDSVWVANDSRHALMPSVMRIDKASGTITQTISTGNNDQTKSPSGLGVDATDVWVVTHNALTTASAHLVRISKATNTIVSDTPLDGSTNFPDGNSLAIDDTYVWIVGYFSGNLLRVTKSNGALMPFTLGGGSRFGIAVGSEAVWVTGGSPANIKRLDKTTGTVTTISGTNFTPGNIALDATTLWVTSTTSGVDQLIPVDRATGTIGQPITLATGCGPYGASLDASSVYVTCPDGSPGSNRYIERVDKTTQQVTPITVGVFPLSLGDATGFAYDHLAP